MNKPAKGQEPSMEEILASIRRIIADDDAAKAQAAGASARPASNPPPRPAPPPPPRPPAAPMPPSSVTLPPVFEVGIAHERRSDIDEVVDRLNATSRKDTGMRGEPEILDLTEDMTAHGEPAPMAPMSAPAPSMAHPEPLAPPPPPPQHASGPPLSPPLRDHPGNGAAEPPVSRTVEEARRQFVQVTAGDRPLLSASTTGAVDSAFNALAQSVLVQNSRTIEDLVREMLRPMLKAWLDDNLPSLVERLVRAEIERVSRGR
jgi:uncharacterized protein